MSADLKAARANVESRIEIWKDSGYPSDRRVAAALSTLLTAMDQGAEALEPFATMGKLIDVWIAKGAPDDEPYQSGGAWSEGGKMRTVTWGDFRAAATVYATLKPVDTKERGGASIPPHLIRLANTPHVEPDHDWDGDEGREGLRDLTEDEG